MRISRTAFLGALSVAMTVSACSAGADHGSEIGAAAVETTAGSSRSDPRSTTAPSEPTVPPTVASSSTAVQTTVDATHPRVAAPAPGGSAASPASVPPPPAPPTSAPPAETAPQTTVPSAPAQTAPPETAPPETVPPATAPAETAPPETAPPETMPPAAPQSRPAGGCQNLGVGPFNEWRAALGIAPLSASSSLYAGACDWASQMAATKNFAHAGGVWEVIAMNQSSCGTAFGQWRNSASHYEIAVNAELTVAAVACVFDGSAYWVVGRFDW